MSEEGRGLSTNGTEVECYRKLLVLWPLRRLKIAATRKAGGAASITGGMRKGVKSSEKGSAGREGQNGEGETKFHKGVRAGRLKCIEVKIDTWDKT